MTDHLPRARAIAEQEMTLRRFAAWCVWIPSFVLIVPFLTIAAVGMLIEVTLGDAWGDWTTRLDRWSKQ